MVKSYIKNGTVFIDSISSRNPAFIYQYNNSINIFLSVCAKAAWFHTGAQTFRKFLIKRAVTGWPELNALTTGNCHLNQLPISWLYSKINMLLTVL